MAVFDPETDRKILPRWRTFDVTLNLGELGSNPTFRLHKKIAHDFLASRVTDWQKYRTANHAADLVGAALTIGEEALAADAADFLLQNAGNVSVWARELAQKVLDSPSCGDDRSESSRRSEKLEKSEQYAQIRTFRQWLRAEPSVLAHK